MRRVILGRDYHERGRGSLSMDTLVGSRISLMGICESAFDLVMVEHCLARPLIET